MQRKLNAIILAWSKIASPDSLCLYHCLHLFVHIHPSQPVVNDPTFHAYHITYGSSPSHHLNQSSYVTINIAGIEVNSALIGDLQEGTDYVVWMAYSNRGGISPNTTVFRLSTSKGEFLMTCELWPPASYDLWPMTPLHMTCDLFYHDLILWPFKCYHSSKATIYHYIPLI